MDGMKYLHAKEDAKGKKKPQLYHQDLKTANILLILENGKIRAKITDFGFSVIRKQQENVKGVGFGQVFSVTFFASTFSLTLSSTSIK